MNDPLSPAPDSDGAVSAPPPKPASRLRRLGCGIALALWFTLLLTPCVVVYLATQGEIVISTGSAPGQQLRLWLMTDERDRGLGISTASTRSSAPDNICVQTNVRFFMWAGRGEDAAYCECYTRAAAAEPWTATDTVTGECPAS